MREKRTMNAKKDPQMPDREEERVGLKGEENWAWIACPIFLEFDEDLDLWVSWNS